MAAELEPVREVTHNEGWAIFNRAARRFLDMSGRDFLIAWDQGDFNDDERPEVYHVALLIPLVR